MLKDNRRLMWTQMSIILRLGLQNMFLQFGTAIVTAMVKNFETLKPRCNRVKENFFRLTQALKALEALRQTKVEIVNLNQWLVKRLISSQTTSEVMLPAILNAGKRGLVKAIDRFDFDYPILFASYARMWVKHELLKKPSAVLRTSLTSPPAEVYTFGDISLKSLIELAKGVANFPPKVPSDDLQARRTNSREVHYGLSLLTSRERRMLMLRCCRPKWTLLAIGNDYKLSKERVRQLCNRSIKRLQSVQPPFPNIKPSDVNSIHFRIEINKSPHRFVSQNQQKTSPLPSYASSNGIQTSRLLKK
ncbi:MAG: sigma factor-like helix-turn-helix DNA-binding protein [Candidatus Hodgkinia cicadicola]